MTGMTGISGTNGMSKNCDMIGMHGNLPKKQIENTQTLQGKPTLSETDGIRGKSIDIRL